MKQKFDFWQDHSDTFLTMAYLWDRRGILSKPDGYGRKTGDCGDTIEMYLQVDAGLVRSIRFELEGCVNTNACCNSLAEIVEGKKIEECWKITPEDVIDYLETLPPTHYHCADLAVSSFYLALADYAAKK